MLLLMGVYFDILVCINEFQIVPWLSSPPVPSSACWSSPGFSTILLRQISRQHHGFSGRTGHWLTLRHLAVQNLRFAAGRRIDLENIMPTAFGGNEMLTLGTVIAGCLVVWLFIWLEKKLPAPGVKA